MSMYFIKTPELLKRMYPNQIWSIPNDKKKIYLTFDDGPTPRITESILQTLNDYLAKATFFLVGENALRYPELVQSIKSEGHSIGNHTHRHLNGWQTNTNAYAKDVLKCEEIISSKLFRPPYGRITRSQTKVMTNRYKVVMWDVLSGDFDHTITKDRVLKNVIDNTKPGSIIVFHDSIKAASRMQFALPRVLEYFTEREYTFAKISR
ncbi:MAG: polysaccharide deacetylase family protein [Chitinophagales bacterium]|nr:polysaccharide deacetylase family protein [Chitinophagales bacterium]